MRIMHISDLHIGLKLLGRDLLEDQIYIVDQIVLAADKLQPDAVVIAGDVYDKAVPSAEAVEVFDTFISHLHEAADNAAIMIISGNHDSARRLDCFRSILSRQNIYLTGMPPVRHDEYIRRVTLRDAYGEVCFYLLPFVRPSMIREITAESENEGALSYREALRRLLERERIDESRRNVLVSHQFYVPAGVSAEDIERSDAEIRIVGNIDEVSAGILAPFDYAALGHLHKPMQVGKERYRYCGSPLATSVSEAGQEKSILVADLLEKGDVRIQTYPLIPRREVRVIRGSLREVTESACDDYVSVILTDREDLDIIDMQSRLHAAFPNLLEIRREGMRSASYDEAYTQEEIHIADPLTLCAAFMKISEQEEMEILKDVIEKVILGGEQT